MTAILLPIALLVMQAAPRTAAIGGVVMADGVPSAPLARAVVTLSGAELRPALTVVTGADGRFVFSGLPAGRFTVTASKATYVTTTLGQAPGAETGVPIALAEGQQLADLTLKLPRGAVIAGRVSDEFGRPLPGAPILVLQYRAIRGERRLVSAGGALPRSDGQGMYRAYGLAPGEYILAACPPGVYKIVDLSMCASGGSDLRQVQPAEIEWAIGQLRAGTRGTVRAATPEPPPGRTVAYGPVLYPATTDPDAAMRITVAAGEHRDGIDFTMQLQPTARVEGRVVGPGGEPAANARILFGTSAWSSSVRSADGTFSRRDLLPGRYFVGAEVPESSLMVRTGIALNGEDVTGMILTLQPAATVGGRVIVETADERPPVDPSTARVTLRAELPGIWSDVSSAVRGDGTFQLGPVAPGRYRLSVSVARADGAGGWIAGRVVVRGGDVTDAAFDVRAGERLSDAAITLTRRRD